MSHERPEDGCYLCGGPVTPDDFCYGCFSFVCQKHEGEIPFYGPGVTPKHQPEAHILEEEDEEDWES